MNPSRYNKERHDYGTANQRTLIPFLESYLGERIAETTAFYDTIDGKTASYDIEIKSRKPNYSYKDFYIMRDGWLLPACKIEHARKSKRPFLCFYYWLCDKSVWVFEFSEEAMEGLEPFVPSWHKEQQLHYNIPFNRWTLIHRFPSQ